MTRRVGIDDWHAHERRHTKVSIMSNNSVPIQEISDTVGHKSTHVTEMVYRHAVAPAIRADRPFLINRTQIPRSGEVKGFEPLTFCMPCLAVPSGGIALSRVTTG
jgi:hypothetical protein